MFSVNSNTTRDMSSKGIFLFLEIERNYQKWNLPAPEDYFSLCFHAIAFTNRPSLLKIAELGHNQELDNLT